ncbi:MAG: hypothetical protein CMO01_02635 [Thalassobius sp.]|nr:hypothetical protein [Thalassovita sp.]
MKSLVNLISVTLVILLFSNLSKAQISCGTVSPTPEQLMSLRLKSTSAADLESLIDKENITYIALKIFLIRTSSGTSVTKLEDIEHDVKATNWYFSRVNIQFYIDNVTYIDDDQFYNFYSEEEYLLRGAYADNNTINVFFPNEIYKNGVEVGGYAYLPPGPKVVFVSSDNTLYSDNTLAHEIGHFFDLYHTHGATDYGTTSELVDGSNCDVAGDMVCDTPADPNLDQLVNGNCEYAGTLIDANGQVYQPDVKNIMSYSNGGCMKYFSEGQFARMLQGFYDKRSSIKYHKEKIDDEIIQIENNYTVVNEVGTKSDIGTFEDPISDDFDGIAVTLFDNGDKLKVNFYVDEAGSYEISVRLRSGNSESGTAYWPDSYLFTVDNEAIALIGDETTISAKYATFGGSYWGEMRGTKNGLEIGSHFLTIEAGGSWGAVDYIKIRKVAEPVNNVPTDISLSSTSILENQPIGTEVGTLSTTDADEGDTHTYSLVEGEGSDNNASFSISGNKLLTGVVFDYETKASYSIRVLTDDAKEGGTFEKTFTITITDEVENTAPTNISLSNSSIKENQPIGTEVGTLSTTDADSGDSFTYSLVSGTGDTDNSSFSIEDNTLKTSLVFDYESKNSYSIRIQTKDVEGESFEKSFTISITDEEENTAPTNITLSKTSVKENQPIGTEVGTLSTTDADSGDSFTYSLVSGTGDTDNSSFSIDGSKLKTAVEFNYETKDSYSIRVQTKDSGGKTYAKVFTISITDEVENMAPTNITLSKTTVKENQPIGTEVGTLSTTDADSGDSFTYSFVSGSGDTDNTSFSIDGSKLKTAVEFNYETKDVYSIRVQTKDSGGKTYAKVFTISITDESEDSAPSNISLSNSSIKENQAVGTEIGSFSTTDSDVGDTHTYSLVSGTGDSDNTSFSIDGSKLKSAKAFDFETKSSYSIRVRTTDTNNKTFEKAFTISVTDEAENNPPTSISISSSNISETAEIGSLVGELSTSDPDLGDIHTYTLVANWDDNTAFIIEGSLVKTAITFDYDMQNRYYIKVKSDDGNGGSTEAIFVISIVNEAGNSAPSGIILNNDSIAEHGETGDVITILKAVDVDGDDSHEFSLVDGTGSDDNGAFYISNDTLYANQSFDYEAKNTFTIRVKVVDADNGSYEEVIQIYIADIAENFTLAGNVVNQANSEVEEGSIALYNQQTYELVSEMNLGSTNSFEFTGLDTGNYILKYSPDIKFEALGVPTYSGNVLIMSEAVVINLNADVTDYTINLLEKTSALTGEETISGTAYKTDENSGGRTNEEVILSGVPVYLLDFQTEEILSNTTSDENGNFTFHQLDAGNYLIKSDYQLSEVEKELNKVPVENGDDSVKIKLSINDVKIWTEVLYVTATDDYQELQGVTFFPNPFGDVLNYEIDNEYIGELELSVLDLSGRLIKNENIQKQQLNYTDQLTLTDLSKGMYLIRIQSDNLSKNLRVIKR